MPKPPISAPGGALPEAPWDPINNVIARWRQAKDALQATADALVEAEEAFRGSSKDRALAKALARAEERSRRAHDAHRAACLRLYRSVPRSAEGLLAVLAAWREERAETEAEEDETELLLGTVEAFVQALVSPPLRKITRRATVPGLRQAARVKRTSETMTRVLRALRENCEEPRADGWADVNLEKARPPDIPRGQFSGQLSNLAREGLYRARQGVYHTASGAWGQVKLDEGGGA